MPREQSSLVTKLAWAESKKDLEKKRPKTKRNGIAKKLKLKMTSSYGKTLAKALTKQKTHGKHI